MRIPLISILLIALPFRIWAQSIVISNEDQDSFIGKQIEYFIDSSSQKEIGQIVDQEFTPSLQTVLNLGYTEYPLWLRVPVENTTGKDIMLVLDNPLFDLIEIYSPQDSHRYHLQKGGLSVTLDERSYKNNRWIFELKNSDRFNKKVYYVKLESRRTMLVPLRITTKKPIITSNHLTDISYGAFFGMMLIMVMFNLMAFLLFKERVYILYILHLIFQMLIISILKGHLFEILDGSGKYFFYYLPSIAGITNITILIFSLEFLNIKKNAPFIYKLLLLVGAIFFIGMVINLVTPNFKLSNNIMHYNVLTLCLVLLTACAISIHKNVLGAKLYLWGMGIFLIGLVILNLSLLDYINSNVFTSNVTLFGSAAEALFLSLAIVNRISILKDEKNQEKQLRINLIEEQRAMLETKVHQRTNELHEKTQEVEAQNEELKQQQEELVAINQQLEEQRNYIEKQVNETLSQNKGLEIVVRERTHQLEKLVKDLIKQNHDLEQFSYIISHNVRAPIARIQGLVNIYNRQQMDDPFNKDLLCYIEQSSKQVDDVIADLTQIISIRNNVDSVIEPIDLSEMCTIIMRGLKDDIERTGAKIYIDFEEVPSIQSVKPYVQSIFYNLISNALKYRSYERSLEIRIKSFKQFKYHRLELIDNGLGMDVSPNDQYKVFGLYQRLHTHVEGKGMGLYLVKTQIEALKGKVELESKLNIGSTFKLYFPKKTN